MNKAATLSGVALLLVASAGPVESRAVRYEIDGRTYVYSTNNRQQTRLARQRIEAANAAHAASARADAELARNPLLRITGSPAQREAGVTRARLQQVLSEPEQTPSVGSASPPSPDVGRQPRRRKALAERNGAPAVEKTEPRRRLARAGVDREVAAKPEEAKPDQKTSAPVPRTPEPALRFAAEPKSPPAAQRPVLKSVTFDLTSGIKTTRLADGTVHEEPLDSSTLSKLGSADPAAESLTSFVDQVRTGGKEDASAPAKPSNPPAN